MCTCGIDIATQQQKPAIASTPAMRLATCRAMPRDGAVVLHAEGCCAGGLAPQQPARAGPSSRAQTTPMPICVCRQPTVCTKCCTIGGQNAPAR